MFNQDPQKSLGEAVEEMLDDRTTHCDFYYSLEYRDNRDKHSTVLRKIENRIGKKLWRKIFRDYLNLEQLEGEFQAELARSCYKLGFNDALQLANQIEETGRGRKTIFN